MQLTLERSEGSGAGPKAVENPRITFDSPKTQVVPWHLWVIGSRTSTDTESHRCSSTLYKMTRISAYGWPSTPADLQPQVKKSLIFTEKTPVSKWTRTDQAVVFTGQRYLPCIPRCGYHCVWSTCTCSSGVPGAHLDTASARPLSPQGSGYTQLQPRDAGTEDSG